MAHAQGTAEQQEEPGPLSPESAKSTAACLELADPVKDAVHFFCTLPPVCSLDDFMQPDMAKNVPL